MDNYIDLKKYLDECDKKYYTNNDSSITDEQYDALKEKYLKLTNQKEYNHIPGKAISSNKKTHKYRALSLDKVKITETEKLKKSIEKLLPVIIQPKFDGCTLVIDSEVTTRGDGKIGDIVTKSTKNIKGIEKLLESRNIFRVECMIKKSDLPKINIEREKLGLNTLKSCRNSATGLLKNLDINNIKGLSLFMYDIMNSSNTHLENIKEMKKFESENIYVANTMYFDNADEAINYINSFDRTKLDYDIDGLVIKNAENKDMGQTAHHPNNAIAVKFVSQGDWTKLLDIVWTVGRTGQVTPNAVFEPIEILNSINESATLNNINYIKALKLEEIIVSGDNSTLVKVIKANDIIPTVIDSKTENNNFDCYVKKIEEPKYCPSCKCKLEKINNLLYCTNSNCNSRIINSVVYMADNFGINNLAESTASKLLKKYIDILLEFSDSINKNKLLDEQSKYNYQKSIKDILSNIHQSFIYSLEKDDIESLPGFAEKSSEKLYLSIQQSKKISFNKFLAGVGIPLVGKDLSEKIAEYYYKNKNTQNKELDSFIYDYNNNFNSLKNMNGIGPKIIQSLLSNYKKIFEPFLKYDFEIYDYIPTSTSTIKKQLNFVITGKFDIPRNEIKTKIKKSGHTVKSSVTKQTDFLLAAPGEDNTTKYKDAIKNNVKIINTLKELKNILEG